MNHNAFRCAIHRFADRCFSLLPPRVGGRLQLVAVLSSARHKNSLLDRGSVHFLGGSFAFSAIFNKSSLALPPFFRSRVRVPSSAWHRRGNSFNKFSDGCLERLLHGEDARIVIIISGQCRSWRSVAHKVLNFRERHSCVQEL